LSLSIVVHALLRSSKASQHGFTSIQERADFVQLLIGDADDMSSKYRPFIWKSIHEDLAAGEENIRFEVAHDPSVYGFCLSQFL
jgi:hypothetical protein